MNNQWKSPYNKPKRDGDYYIILTNGHHRIVKYKSNGGWGGYKWIGDTGISTDCFNDNEIKCWTNIPADPFPEIHSPYISDITDLMTLIGDSGDTSWIKSKRIISNRLIIEHSSNDVYNLLLLCLPYGLINFINVTCYDKTINVELKNGI